MRSEFVAIAVSALALCACASGKDAPAEGDAGVTFDAALPADANVGGADAGGDACSEQPCFPGVTCTADEDAAEGYVCGACPSGTDGDGQSCDEIDGCADDPCFDDVVCMDIAAPGTGYSCGGCPAGYDGDGTTCTDVDGCAGDPCFDGVTCTDVAAPGTGYSCGACPAGTEGDGMTCTEIDGCAVDPCFDGVTCTDVDAPGTGYSCGVCPAGTEGDGMTCTDVDGCEGDPCFDGVTCTDVAAPGTGYSCGACPAGTEGDGMTCSEIDGCEGDPCFDGVTCTDVAAPGTGYSCGACPAGYDGDGETCARLCDEAGLLQCGGQIVASNDGAGSADQVDDWECAGFSLTGPEIVYAFVPDDSGQVSASLSGLSGDLDLLVVEASGGICDPYDGTTCAAYSGTGGTTSEFATWDAIAGTTYYLIVDGWSGATSSFTLAVGTASTSIQLSQIGLGGEDFVEVQNLSACTVDFVGMAILHKPALESVSFEYLFPAGTVVAPGGVVRLMESGASPFSSNEIDAERSIADWADDVGWTALCDGSCDQVDCTNMVDYVERDDDPADATAPDGPACAGFAPAPVDASTATVNAAAPYLEESLFKVNQAGAPASWQASDWAFGTSTRD